jgi:hypothetical protein
MIRNNIISNWLNKKGNKDIAKKVKLEFILNDALNKAMCQKGRIQNPDSNKVAEFVTEYLKTEKLPLQDVVVPKGTLCDKVEVNRQNSSSATWTEDSNPENYA